MKNRWNIKKTQDYIKKYKKYGKDLALRTYTAQLIGQDPSLVLHGGGNTSVKTKTTTVTGDTIEVLCVKGSGWDLGNIEPQGHPAIKLDALRSLRSLATLSDEDMVNLQRTHMLDFTGPNPSVETLLHAFLPHKFIDHTHADAVLAIINQQENTKYALEWCQNRLAVVPYIMPGFALSKLASKIYEENPSVEGLVLINHGIITFGDTAYESYSRMITWVHKAELFLKKTKPFAHKPVKVRNISDRSLIGKTAQLIRSCSTLKLQTGKEQDSVQRMIVRFRTSNKIKGFVNSEQVQKLSQIGPPTPDHVIRTKIKPLLLQGVSVENETAFSNKLRSEFKRYANWYQNYVARQSSQKKISIIPLDPLPRVILVPGSGIYAIGKNAQAADIALDIYEHTIDIIINASRLGNYKVLSEKHLFDMEYWSLEQAKLGKGSPKPFDGKIVWASGAASGIGLATAKAFAKDGAHVFLTDIQKERLHKATQSLGIGNQAAYSLCDVTKTADVKNSFALCAKTFGGVDIVVSNAGIAPMSNIKNCSESLLRKSFEINFFAHQNVAQAAADIFERQSLGGCLLFNASKSSFNPGPEFGPYTLPKSAVITLMKQYAVELGNMGVRSNAVNADRIQTNLYGDGLLKRRAKARGLTINEYLSGNLVGEEVFAEDVAKAFVHLALSRKTTGAVLPVDGGNAAAFPR